jgi:hypothetical protein
MTTGTDLYRRTISRDYSMPGSGELMRRTWSTTPWMVEAYTGRSDDDRYTEIRLWCRDQFGAEAFLDREPGAWRSGHATVDGWTWMGFATEEQMQQFLARWPAPNEKLKPTRGSAFGLEAPVGRKNGDGDDL